MAVIKFYNTLTRKKEIFKPLNKGRVGLYTCGPTVYNYAHIGNLRTYIFEDILRKTLEYSGYNVKHVMNITDVGHLTSDADVGEDKLEKEAQKEKKTVWEIAEFYTKEFLKDLELLNVKKANIISPATKNIKEQIFLIKRLIKKDLAYETEQAIYFDVSKFKNYTKLSRQKLSEKITGAREDVIVDSGKQNPQDFVLWFKVVGHFKNHIMQWNSPWGKGFPGWHIECSAISTKYLGQPFDIHTGGIDHINVHHTNEIAQSEGAYNKPLARYWMHGEFLLIDESRMGKSEGNFLTLKNIIEKKINPLAFRYLVLTSHYRSKLNFTFASLQAAENSLNHFYSFIQVLLRESDSCSKNNSDEELELQPKSKINDFKTQFEKAIYDDLNTPKAVATIWKFINEYYKNPEKFDSKKILNILCEFDKVLGFDFKKIKIEKIPKEIKILIERREKLRKEKNWQKADEIRKELKTLGWELKDTPEGIVGRRTSDTN